MSADIVPLQVLPDSINIFPATTKVDFQYFDKNRQKRMFNQIVPFAAMVPFALAQFAVIFALIRLQKSVSCQILNVIRIIMLLLARFIAF